MSVEPASHLVHLDGYAVAVTANFNNVHWSTPLERGIWDTDHYRYVTILGPDRCQLPNGMRRKPKERPKPPLFIIWAQVRVTLSHPPGLHRHDPLGFWRLVDATLHRSPGHLPDTAQCVQLACDNFGNCFVFN